MTMGKHVHVCVCVNVDMCNLLMCDMDVFNAVQNVQCMSKVRARWRCTIAHVSTCGNIKHSWGGEGDGNAIWQNSIWTALIAGIGFPKMIDIVILTLKAETVKFWKEQDTDGTCMFDGVLVL